MNRFYVYRRRQRIILLTDPYMNTGTFYMTPEEALELSALLVKQVAAIRKRWGRVRPRDAATTFSVRV